MYTFGNVPNNSQSAHEISLNMFSLLSKFQERVKSNTEKRRWWLFNATDFQSLMYPCFIFCRILGILPYKINALSFKISKLNYILSAAVTCFFGLYVLIIIYINISEYWFKDVRRAIEMNSFYISGSFILIVTFILNRPRLCLLQTILKISSILPSETYSKLSVLIHTKDIFCFFYVLILLLFGYHREFSVLYFVTSLYVALLVLQMDMLYINCVCVLKTCFKKINDDLANLFIMHEEPHSVMRIYHRQCNPLLLMKLNALKKRHLILSDAVQRLKMIFSPQLLATITIIFIQFTFELYFNIIDWHNGLSIVLNSQIYHTNVIFIIGYLFAKLMLIAWVCETGKNRALKISTTIHDVLNSTNNAQIKYELQLFSLQIMHCDNTFSVKGLCLGMKLITMMVGTISTYLLILIQFLIMTHSCDGRAAINITQTNS